MRFTMIPSRIVRLCRRLGLVIFFGGAAFDAAFSAPAVDRPGEGVIRAAAEKALPLLEAGAKGSMDERSQCFTCHNQGMPVMALTIARDRGLKVDSDNLDRQLQFISDFLAKNRSNYLEGKGQGGQALTAGAALLALELGGRKPDATTAAVVEYLLRWQSDQDHWKVQTVRPPSEESLFTVSYVALRALKTFGTVEQKDRIAERTARVGAWVLKAPATSTEDRVFRLWALKYAGGGSDELTRARQELLELQRADGGWGQLPDLAADSYATGTALVALHQAGGLPTADPSYRRGLEWLLAAQNADGSWHVATRSKPIQSYYESGYPHGKDQFISIAAASWSTTALALALPSR